MVPVDVVAISPSFWVSWDPNSMNFVLLWTVVVGVELPWALLLPKEFQICSGSFWSSFWTEREWSWEKSSVFENGLGFSEFWRPRRLVVCPERQDCWVAECCIFKSIKTIMRSWWDQEIKEKMGLSILAPNLNYFRKVAQSYFELRPSDRSFVWDSE